MNLDELYDRHADGMYRFLALRLDSPEDAEDVLQETFCRLARYDVRWAFIRNERAFVFKVLRNESHRFLRRKLRGAARETPSGDIAHDGVRAERPGPEVDAPILAALASLPGPQKEVIILKVYQDFSFKDISGIVGVSINTAASRYRYGIEKLRALLERNS